VRQMLFAEPAVRCWSPAEAAVTHVRLVPSADSSDSVQVLAVHGPHVSVSTPFQPTQRTAEQVERAEANPPSTNSTREKKEVLPSPSPRRCCGRRWRGMWLWAALVTTTLAVTPTLGVGLGRKADGALRLRTATVDAAAMADTGVGQPGELWAAALAARRTQRLFRNSVRLSARLHMNARCCSRQRSVPSDSLSVRCWVSLRCCPNHERGERAAAAATRSTLPGRAAPSSERVD
jgi:hypothetical protein